MQAVKSYKDLVAWQKAMDLVQAIYTITAHFPAVEKFGLISQLRRAAVSIPSNIAEGHGRRTRMDYVHFLDMARGSANEVETQLLIAIRLRFVDNQSVAQVIDLAQEVQRILRGLVNSLNSNSKKTWDTTTGLNGRS